MKILPSLIVLFLCTLTVLARQRKSNLKCGEYLAVDEFIESTNGYYAVTQSDCNFVIFRSKHFIPRNALWVSQTVTQDCKNPILVNQNDGTVAIYNNGFIDAGNKIWSSGNSVEQICQNLFMHDDRNLVLYTLDDQAVWSTQTSA